MLSGYAQFFADSDHLFVTCVTEHADRVHNNEVVSLKSSSGRTAGWMLLAVLCGVFLGVGVFTFGYAKGSSYSSQTTPRPAPIAM